MGNLAALDRRMFVRFKFVVKLKPQNLEPRINTKYHQKMATPQTGSPAGIHRISSNINVLTLQLTPFACQNGRFEQ